MTDETVPVANVTRNEAAAVSTVELRSRVERMERHLEAVWRVCSRFPEFGRALAAELGHSSPPLRKLSEIDAGPQLRLVKDGDQ